MNETDMAMVKLMGSMTKLLMEIALGEHEGFERSVCADFLSDNGIDVDDSEGE